MTRTHTFERIQQGDWYTVKQSFRKGLLFKETTWRSYTGRTRRVTVVDLFNPQSPIQEKIYITIRDFVTGNKAVKHLTREVLEV